MAWVSADQIAERDARLLDAAHWRCEPLDLATVTVDHVLGRADGGSDWAGNLVASCVTCNCERGSESAGAFAARRAHHNSAVISAAIQRARDPKASVSPGDRAADRDRRRRLRQHAKAYNRARQDRGC